MCLLIVSWRVDPSFPLIIGANRDERLDRPAVAWTVLDAGPPRLVGGRDELAGGTWLAINEFGAFAGLTNRPTRGGPDAARRSRGRLPLLLLAHDRVEEGMERFLSEVRSDDYNPAWLMAGDRDRLFYLEVGVKGRPSGRELDAGTYVLENVPLDSPSPKVAFVRSAIGSSGPSRLWESLPAILSSHHVPGARDIATDGDAPDRLIDTYAPCVHTPRYGTRSSTMIRLAASASTPPEVLVADGPPCTTPFQDMASLW
jgi:uncharacterized protein with NRDE domain